MISGRINSINQLLPIVHAYVTSSIHGETAWQAIQVKPYPYCNVYSAPKDNGERVFVSLTVVDSEEMELNKWIQDGECPELATKYRMVGGNKLVEYYHTSNKGYPSHISNHGTVFIGSIHKQFDSVRPIYLQGGGYRTTCRHFLPQVKVSSSGGFVGITSEYECHPVIGLPSLAHIRGYNGSIDYYIHMQKTALTVILVFTDRPTKYWQVFSVGLLETSDKSYSFPAYLSSPNFQTPYVYRFNDIPVHGYALSYEHNNYALSNSHLLMSNKQGIDCPSNFKVCLPNGVWLDCYSTTQNYTYKTQTAPIKWDAVELTPPIYAVGSDTKILYSERDYKSLITGYSSKPYDVNVYNKIIIYANLSDFKGILGTVPSHFYVNNTSKCAEVEKNGKRGLICPNGWEYRCYHIPDYIKNIETSTVENVVSRYLTNLHEYTLSYENKKLAIMEE